MGDPVSLPKTGSRVSPKPWTLLSLLLILLISDTLDGQLIGSRGVFTLPEGMEYRDAITRDASRVAADFAMNFQVKEDMRVKEKYKKKSKATARKHAPFFGPKPLVKGRPLTPVEVLDFRDSRFLNPPEELRMNKILPEVEMERTTSSIRLLMEDTLNPPKNVRPPPKQFPTFEAVRSDAGRDVPKQFTSFDAVRSKPDSFESARTNKDARMQFPTFEAVPTPVPSKQRKMGPRKDGGTKKQRFMGGGGSVKPRKNQQIDRRPQSFQRFMSMQAMDHAGRKEPDALQRIFPIENEVTRSGSKPFQSRPLMGAKLRPPQRTFEQEISPGRKPSRPLVAPSRIDKGERPRSHFDSPALDETRLGFQRVTPGPRPFMSPPPRSRMRSRQFGGAAAKPNGFRPSLNSVNPIDGGGGGGNRPFIQSQLHQSLGPGPSGFRSGDEFGLGQHSPTPQSHRGARPGLGVPPPPERSRSEQSVNRPSRLQLLPTPAQALRPSSRFRQFGDREPVTEVEELKHEPLKPLRPRRPTAQPIFQVFAQHQPIRDLSTNSLDHDVDLISSSSPAPPVSFKLGRLRGGARKGPRKKHPRPLPTPIRVSSPRPRVFDRTPSSLTDINSNVVSSNVFGRKSTANFLVEGPNYSISWGR